MPKHASLQSLRTPELNDLDSCAVFPHVSAFRIKEYREQRGMTQEQFARAYGVSLRTLKRWESDSVSPRFGSAFRQILNDWMGSIMRTNH